MSACVFMGSAGDWNVYRKGGHKVGQEIRSFSIYATRKDKDHQGTGKRVQVAISLRANGGGIHAELTQESCEAISFAIRRNPKLTGLSPEALIQVVNAKIWKVL